MKRLTSILAVATVVTVGACGSRISPAADVPTAQPRSAGTVEATHSPGCIDFDHPEASRDPNLISQVASQLETRTTQGCFQVHSFVETGVATSDGFTPLGVLLERHANEVDVWVFDWTILRLSRVGTFPNSERVHVEVVDPGHRAILVSTNGAGSRRGIVFIPNRQVASVPPDTYVPASTCLVLQRDGTPPWFRTETRLEAETGNLIVDYVGVDAESSHQASLPWNAEEQRFALPDGWLSHEESTCFYPEAAAPEAP